MEAKPTVLVVDDDSSVRHSLRLLIESAGWQSETFASAQEFLARPRTSGASCLLLDVFLPDINGCDLQNLLADRPEVPIIFMSGHGDVPMTARAMKAGAMDFFTKPLANDELLRAIGDAIDRSRAVLCSAEHRRALLENYESLSPRQRQVMALIVRGRLNKQAGGELGISEITVKAHRGNVMRKMNADSLPDLVRMADRLSSLSALKR
ncbi:MAG: two component transcriptional regulator, LuxR family [Nitrobacter vulgaris]|nr:two component transcriptional regulator, LuxR family [Nitrobacter vulgaris]